MTKIKPYNPDAILCYVKNGVAFFTTQSLDKQWGDDWNDAPYEHNAGEPYEWDDRSGVDPYSIYKIHFEADMSDPRDFYSYNSPFSVEQINKGVMAWLSPPSYSKHGVVIPAGETLKAFIQKIRSINGKIFMEIE